MERALIIITSVYPYVETFLQTELIYLAKSYHQIVIVTNHPKQNIMCELPDNVKVIHNPYELTVKMKIASIFQVFTSLFWIELMSVRKSKALSRNVINTMLTSLYRGRRFSRYLKSLLKEYDQKMDPTVYSYWCNDMALGVALFRNSHSNVKCISRAHGSDLYHEASTCNYLAYRSFIANNLSAIITISNFGKRYIETKWGNVSNAVLKVSKLGVINSFDFNKAYQKGNCLKIVSCSTDMPVKRMDLIINALSIIDDIDIRWIHIGDGGVGDKVKSLAEKQLGNKSNLSFKFMGRIKNEEVQKLYNDVLPDVFINVSASEGIPVSIMESFSFGIPVIATNVGAVHEIVHEKNGTLLSSTPSIIEIEEAIRKYFYMDAESFQNKRNFARKEWENKHDAEVNYKKFIAIVNKI
jgi:colanic acid/amylovoran biosynthesis glycosyltransferase